MGCGRPGVSARRALLIEGARRVGKSTLAREFGRNEYASCPCIDFFEAPDEVRGYFEDYRADFDTLFLYLSTYYGVELHRRDTLVIFDEVQAFPLARGLIKYLVADGRYDSGARIANLCFAAADPSVGPSLNMDQSTPKCYMADTGLPVTLALADNALAGEDVYRSVLRGEIGVNAGMLAENVVAQMLRANGHRLFFYSQSGKETGEKRMGIDFLIVSPYANAAERFGGAAGRPVQPKEGVAAHRPGVCTRQGWACGVHTRMLAGKPQVARGSSDRGARATGYMAPHARTQAWTMRGNGGFAAHGGPLSDGPGGSYA